MAQARRAKHTGPGARNPRAHLTLATHNKAATAKTIVVNTVP
jgi:hypothetical protein